MPNSDPRDFLQSHSKRNTSDSDPMVMKMGRHAGNLVFGVSDQVPTQTGH